MTGRDFIDCADLRSAASRAYYGAFHSARELLESVGIRLPKTEQMHLKVAYCTPFAADR